MIRRSPHTVRYSDLIKLAVRFQVESKARYEWAKTRGTSALDPLVREQEVAKALVRLLKRFDPASGLDLFEVFQK